jgi:hypothetical protein
MRIGMLFALLATVSMMLGLLRWPSIHWVLAEAYARGGEPERTVLAAVFTGLDWPAHPWCRPRGFGIFATTDVTSSHPYRSFARREGPPRERCTARDFVGRE